MSQVNERDAVDALVRHLKESLPYEICYSKHYVLKSSEFFPTQPEIDLILCRVVNRERVPPLRAAEVKYIRGNKDNRVTPSYYSGLDEALALLLFGFDMVELIHIVEERSLPVVYPNLKTLSALIKTLGLPLGYRVYAFAPGTRGIHWISGAGPGNILYYNLKKDLWVEPQQNPLLTANDDLGNTARKNRELLCSPDQLDVKCEM